MPIDERTLEMRAAKAKEGLTSMFTFNVANVAEQTGAPLAAVAFASFEHFDLFAQLGLSPERFERFVTSIEAYYPRYAAATPCAPLFATPVATPCATPHATAFVPAAPALSPRGPRCLSLSPTSPSVS